MAQLGVVQLFLCVVAIGLGAWAQGAVGTGLTYVALPILMVVRPEALPATLLLLAIPITGFMAIQERASIDRGHLKILLAGRLGGTVVGTGLLTVVSADLLGMLFGGCLIGAALMNATGPSTRVGKETTLLAGTLSGIMGTTAAIGGPPLALAYRGRSGPEIRSTLAVVFLVGIFMSLLGLFSADMLHGWHFVLAAQLFPAILLGLYISRLTRPLIDQRYLRPAILLLSVGAGISAMVIAALG